MTILISTVTVVFLSVMLGLIVDKIAPDAGKKYNGWEI